MKKVKVLLTIAIMAATTSLHAQDFKSRTNNVKKSALILIETQNEWMHPDGLLYKRFESKEMFDKSVQNLESVLAYARKTGMPVIHCGLRFQKGHPELANGKTGLREAISCFETFPDSNFRSDFYETLIPIEGEFITSGRTGSSGFAGSNLDIFLRHNNIETLYLVGYATNVCVESTFREAHDKGYYPVMIHDACATFDNQQQEHVLKHIVHHYGEAIDTDYFTKMYNESEKWLHDSWLFETGKLSKKSDEEAIKEILTESFLNGALNKLDADKMRDGFHPDFAILIANEDKLNKLPLNIWIDVVNKYKASSDKVASGERNVDYSFETIDITGNAAIVKIQLLRKGQLITTDYISLLKYADGWKAVSKISNEHIPNPFNI
ncbi:isochorismatase family protein [Dysgonomonas sp. Marseille-Q5470]|uniref:isochorismatase family protein n=1 Tax=Dysgonomonas TaxID=156973 RepID=UPI0024BC62A4|nr:isochorismatase family protein [Dysgonomonas sp. Marseille-Q5470]MBS5979280.1 isochorismatase family protein [Dysgonomonas mossii]